jgi:uncharacterized protein YvpB
MCRIPAFMPSKTAGCCVPVGHQTRYSLYIWRLDEHQMMAKTTNMASINITDFHAAEITVIDFAIRNNGAVSKTKFAYLYNREAQHMHLLPEYFY